MEREVEVQMKLKTIGIFIAGAVVGATSCYFFVKKHFEDIAQKEIDDVKSHYHFTKGYGGVEEVEDSEDVKKATEDYRKIVDTYTGKDITEVQEINYSDYAAMKIGEEVKRNIEAGRYDDTMSKNEYPEDENLPPYIIDSTDFGQYHIYGQTTFLYYLENEALIDEESNELVDDIEGTIGRENLNVLLNIPESTIYVRNVALGMEYMVMKVNGEWL